MDGNTRDGRSMISNRSSPCSERRGYKGGSRWRSSISHLDPKRSPQNRSTIVEKEIEMASTAETLRGDGGSRFIGSASGPRPLLETAARSRDRQSADWPREKLAEIRHRIDFHRWMSQWLAIAKPVNAGADTVFHLAAIPSVPRSIRRAGPFHEVNTNGTFDVFSGLPRPPKSAAWFMPLRPPHTATANVAQDRDDACDAQVALRRAEICWASLTLRCSPPAFGLETVSLRFFNVYGARQDPSSALFGIFSCL